jgi:hypothetical protein
MTDEPNDLLQGFGILRRAYGGVAKDFAILCRAGEAMQTIP